VIKNLHPSTDILYSFIKSELSALGFQARNINNVRHRQSKLTLPIFLIDLEPDSVNFAIFKARLHFASQKLKLNHRTPRKTFHNASIANLMAIHVHTVATNQDAFAVVKCMTLLYVKKYEMNLPNVPYAVARTQQIIKLFCPQGNHQKTKASTFKSLA